MTASLLRRILLCPFGLCQTFRQQEDDTGVWGACTKCTRTAGFVDRTTLRRYLDNEPARETAAEVDRLRHLAQSRYELLRECQTEFRARGATGLAETIETALRNSAPRHKPDFNRAPPKPGSRWMA